MGVGTLFYYIYRTPSADITAAVATQAHNPADAKSGARPTPLRGSLFSGPAPVVAYRGRQASSDGGEGPSPAADATADLAGGTPRRVPEVAETHPTKVARTARVRIMSGSGLSSDEIEVSPSWHSILPSARRRVLCDLFGNVLRWKWFRPNPLTSSESLSRRRLSSGSQLDLGDVIPSGSHHRASSFEIDRNRIVLLDCVTFGEGLRRDTITPTPPLPTPTPPTPPTHRCNFRVPASWGMAALILRRLTRRCLCERPALRLSAAPFAALAPCPAASAEGLRPAPADRLRVGHSTRPSDSQAQSRVTPVASVLARSNADVTRYNQQVREEEEGRGCAYGWTIRPPAPINTAV